MNSVEREILERSAERLLHALGDVEKNLGGGDDPWRAASRYAHAYGTVASAAQAAALAIRRVLEKEEAV